MFAVNEVNKNIIFASIYNEIELITNFVIYIQQREIMEVKERLTNCNTNSICRICMQDDRTLLPIVYEVLFGDNVITVADIISECTKYPVAQNDLLPNQICSNCLETARIAHQFKRQTEDAYRHFKSLYDTTWVPKEENDIGYYDIGTGFITSEKYTQTEKCSECETCNKRYLISNQIRESSEASHKNDCDLNGPKDSSVNKSCIKDFHCNNKCHICSKKFNSKGQLTRHLVKVHTT